MLGSCWNVARALLRRYWAVAGALMEHRVGVAGWWCGAVSHGVGVVFISREVFLGGNPYVYIRTGGLS